MMRGDQQRLVATLMELSEQIDPQRCFPALVPEASELILADPYAFCLATCLDRGMKADVIWTIPYWMMQRLGHLDPHRVYQMSMDRLASLVEDLPKRPRYVHAAPRTIHEITATVVDEFGGDASRIWKNTRAADVKATFRSVYGVGPGIASMAVLLLERGYGIRFSDLDHTTMDIKPDVHTMRVLYRLGAAPHISEAEAIAAARRLNPSYPGEIDAALWHVGRDWCNAQDPLCEHCPLDDVCAKVGRST